MNVAIDGIIFSLQRAGGISVYFRELLRVLAAHGDAGKLLLEQPVRQELALAPGLLERVDRQARRLERYRPARVPSDASVFHSSYFRRPDRSDVPTVVTVHDFIYERFRHGPAKWGHMWQKHAAIRAAQAVICISESTRNDLRRFIGDIPGQAVHVVHCGVGDGFRPLGLQKEVPPFILVVGERGGYKNFRLALQALALLPDLEIHCVGGGALRPEEFGGIAADVRARVRHLGFVTDAELNERYNHAQCLLYPSAYEGFGIPPLEAMRAGCPVVCIACDAVLEVGGPALTVAESATPEAVAAAVDSTREPSRRAGVVQRGLERAALFSWDMAHERTRAVYKSLGA